MKRIFFLIPLILLPACASKKPVIVEMPRSVPGTVLTTDEMQSVRYGENIEAYCIGRYVDPNNPLVMHEAHTIYRVETTAKWNLHPNPLVYVPGGPVVGIIDPAHKDGPLTPEVIAELEKQKAATQELLRESRKMNDAAILFSKAIPATLQVAGQNAQLQAEVYATDRRIDELEDEFRKTQSGDSFTISADPSAKGTNDW